MAVASARPLCKQSAPRSRQITTSTPRHSILQAWCPTNSVKALKVIRSIFEMHQNWWGPRIQTAGRFRNPGPELRSQFGDGKGEVGRGMRKGKKDSKNCGNGFHCPTHYIHRAVLTNGHTEHVPRPPRIFFLFEGLWWHNFLKTHYLITFAKINCKGNPVNTF